MKRFLFFLLIIPFILFIVAVFNQNSADACLQLLPFSADTLCFSFFVYSILIISGSFLLSYINFFIIKNNKKLVAKYFRYFFYFVNLVILIFVIVVFINEFSYSNIIINLMPFFNKIITLDLLQYSIIIYAVLNLYSFIFINLFGAKKI